MENNLIIKNIYDELSKEISGMKFSAPAARSYNPLQYASDGLEKYLNYSNGQKRAVFVGMNPGPWGMAQTGVPFGEVSAVKNFLKLNDIHVNKPENEHESYKITGLECPRSEVSGKRLWGLFEKRFGTAGKFFAGHFVLNYCPLLFLADNGRGGARNLTPDKLKKPEREILFAACSSCLRKIIGTLNPEFIIGIGGFAEERSREALKGLDIKITRILHPSPASPQSNRDWDKKVTAQLTEAGVWEE